VAGYYSRCPSGKSKTIRFISALFILNYQSRSDTYFRPARSAGLNVCDCLRQIKNKYSLRFLRLGGEKKLLKYATVFMNKIHP